MYSTQKLAKVNLNFINQYHPIETLGDGNCFYYSISILLFGSCKFFKLIRMALCYISLEYKTYVENLIQINETKYDFSTFIFNTIKQDSWADQVNIWVATLVLLKPIYVFFIDVKHQEYAASEALRKNPSICLLHFNKNHFMPLMPDQPQTSVIKPEIIPFPIWQIKIKYY